MLQRRGVLHLGIHEEVRRGDEDDDLADREEAPDRGLLVEGGRDDRGEDGAGNAEEDASRLCDRILSSVAWCQILLITQALAARSNISQNSYIRLASMMFCYRHIL